MKEVNIIEICREVLTSLSEMGYEKKWNTATEQLIFPMITETKKENKKQETENRISEQELRQLFIDKFKAKAKTNPNLYYSIETPTKAKYKFGEVGEGKELKNIKVDEEKGQSALLDMCVFKQEDNSYNRKLNIEFKHGNAPLKDIAKDVLKLMHENESGAFIFLLDNTNSGSLNNSNKRSGVLDKLSKSFTEFYNRDKGSNWNGNEKKGIHLIILSLELKKNSKGPVLIHRTITQGDLGNSKDLEMFFSINNNRSGNITEVSKESGWKLKPNKN